MNKNIEWRPVKGFPYYEVSNDGQVRSVPHEIQKRVAGDRIVTQVVGGKILKAHVAKGLKRVNLFDDGVTKPRPVAQLVAQAFIPKEDESQERLTFKDGDKLNCHMDNLEWVTRSESLKGINTALSEERRAKVAFLYYVVRGAGLGLEVPISSMLRELKKAHNIEIARNTLNGIIEDYRELYDHDTSVQLHQDALNGQIHIPRKGE